MSGGGSGNTTTTTKAELPSWLANAAQDNLNRAVDYNKDYHNYQQYTEPRIAGQTPDQLQAAQAIRNMQGQTGAALGSLGASSAALGGYQAQQVTPQTLAGTNLQPYMNPYTGEVETNALRALEGTRQDSQNQIGDQFLSSKAFGGSRQALQSAVTDAQFGQRAGDLSSQLRQANFAQAQQAATGDISRNLAAQQANQQAGLASAGIDLSAYKQAADIYGQRQGAEARDIGLLDTSGGQQQQMNQGALDLQYQNWMEGNNYYKSQIEWLQQMLGSTPGSGTTTVNAGGGSKASPALGALGGAASGAAIGTQISPGYGTAIGAAAGALFGGLSSR
jgi:hypothetical protein